MTYPYLVEKGKVKVVHTHRVTVKASFEVSEGNREERINEIRKLVDEKIEEWRKVSLKHLRFRGNIIEVVVHTSEPASCYLPRIRLYSSEVVGSYAYFCLYDLEEEGMPAGVKVKKEKIEVEQILFPERENKQYVIRF